MKRKRIKSSAFILVGILLIAGCKKDEIVTINGISQGYVHDTYTNDPISGAKVMYSTGNKTDSVTTDANGFFTITGLPAGSTPLTVTKTGYASRSYDTWIEPLYSQPAVKGGGSVDIYDNVNIDMPQLTAGLQGVILKKVSSTNQIRPAANFEITVMTNNNYSPSYFTTTTDDAGAFSFSNLPGVKYSSIIVEPTSDADNYYYYSTSRDLIPNATTELYTTLNRTDKGIVLVSTNLDIGNGEYTRSFPIGDNIMLTFNMPVSATNTKDFGSINLTGYSLDLNSDVTFNGSVVTINPPSNLANNTNYTLSFSIYSTTQGDYVSKSIQFRTEN